MDKQKTSQRFSPEVRDRAAAEKKNSILTIPDWPQTPEAVATMTQDAIAKASAALDAIEKAMAGV